VRSEVNTIKLDYLGSDLLLERTGTDRNMLFVNQKMCYYITRTIWDELQTLEEVLNYGRAGPPIVRTDVARARAEHHCAAAAEATRAAANAAESTRADADAAAASAESTQADARKSRISTTLAANVTIATVDAAIFGYVADCNAGSDADRDSIDAAKAAKAAKAAVDGNFASAAAAAEIAASAAADYTRIAAIRHSESGRRTAAAADGHAMQLDAAATDRYTSHHIVKCKNDDDFSHIITFVS
jgi:hypothetical protein